MSKDIGGQRVQLWTSALDPGARFSDKQAMTKASGPDLPIDDALPALLAALRQNSRAVLQAPPGAGKTTKVPLAMLQAGLTEQRIVMLEPRRLAARAAAERWPKLWAKRLAKRSAIAFAVRQRPARPPASKW